MSLLNNKHVHGMVKVSMNRAKSLTAPNCSLGFWTKQAANKSHRLVSTIIAVEDIRDDEGNLLDEDAVDVRAEIRFSLENGECPLFDELLEIFSSEEFADARKLNFVFALSAPCTYHIYNMEDGSESFNIHMYCNEILSVEAAVTQTPGIKFESQDDRRAAIKAAAAKAREQRDNAIATNRATRDAKAAGLNLQATDAATATSAPAVVVS